MMRWNSGDIGFEVKDDEVREPSSGEDRVEPGTLFTHVVDMLAATLTRTGVTSVAVAVTVAILIATVLLGLAAADTAAMGQWCSRC